MKNQIYKRTIMIHESVYRFGCVLRRKKPTLYTSDEASSPRVRKKGQLRSQKKERSRLCGAISAKSTVGAVSIFDEYIDIVVVCSKSVCWTTSNISFNIVAVTALFLRRPCRFQSPPIPNTKSSLVISIELA
jgi:hypothetical protein